MRLVVAVVGRPRSAGLAAATADYETRAARYWPLEVREVREEPARGLGVDVVQRREGERLLARAEPGEHVACDATGRSFTSEQFAAWLSALRDAARNVTFFIGGAVGLSSAIRGQCSMGLALAPWTLPHELARCVLAEQLYRAGTIQRGEPYHK